MNVTNTLLFNSMAELSGMTAMNAALAAEQAATEGLALTYLEMTDITTVLEARQATLASAITGAAAGAEVGTAAATALAGASDLAAAALGALGPIGAAAGDVLGTIVAGGAAVAEAAFDALGTVGAGVLRAGLATVDAAAATTGAVLEGLGGAAAATFGGIKAVVAGLSIPILGIGVVSTVMAEKYEHAMNKVYALTGATADEMTYYSKEVLKLSTVVGQSAKSLADGLYFVVSAGFKGADAMNVLAASARAAAAGQTETLTVADAVTSVLNAYSLASTQATAVTDILTQAVTQGKTQYGDLAGAVGKVIPLAAAVGIGFDQLAASLATMTRVGANADEAATGLRAVMTAIVRPTNASRDALKEMGMTTADLRKLVGDQGLAGALQTLWQRSGQNVEVMAKLIPNIRGLTTFLGTAVSQTKSYNEILYAMQNAGGTTADAFAKAQEDAGFQFSVLKATLGSLAITIGMVLLPPLIEVTQRISDAAAEVTGWAAENPALVKQIVTLGAAIGALGLAAGGAKMILGPLVGMMPGLGAALGPILVPLGIVAATLGGLYLGITNNIAGLGAFKPALSQAGTVIGQFGADTQRAIADLQKGKGIGEALGEYFKVDATGEQIQKLSTTIVSGFQSWTAGVPRMVGEFTDSVAKYLGEMGPKVERAIPGLISSAYKMYLGFVEAFYDALPSIINNVFDGLQRVFDWILSDGVPLLANTASQLFDTIAKEIPIIIPKVIKALGTLVGRIGQFIIQEGPKLGGKLVEWSQAFVGWVMQRLPSLLNSLGQLVGRVFAWIGQEAPKLGQQLLQWAAQFVGWIGDAISKIPGALAELITGIGKWIIANAPSIGKNLGTWAAQFLEFAADLAISMPGRLVEVMIAIGKWIVENAPGLVVQAAQLGGAIVQGILGGITGAVGAAPGVIAQIVGWVTGTMVPALVDGAGALVKGFIDMGTALGKGLANAIVGFFGSGINWMIDKLNSLKFNVDIDLGPLGKQHIGWDGLKLGHVSLPTFDVGAFDIPDTMAAIIHQHEMIIPRPFADEIRSNVTAGRPFLPSGGTGGTDRQLAELSAQSATLQKIAAAMGLNNELTARQIASKGGPMMGLPKRGVQDNQRLMNGVA